MKNFKNFKNANIHIPKDVLEIAKEFSKANKEIYLVGGAIRDFLQNKSPHDFDLVTNALPHETKKILKNFNVSDEQGKNFGVLRVYTDLEPLGHEIATFRKDISKGRDTKGENDKVEIGNHITIEDDVLRRDLTINALFYNISDKQIVDLVGGVEDLKNNIIRTVGNPQERFNEDRLRIMRVFRFAARTNSIIDDNTSKAINLDNRLFNISNEDDVSKERIHEEWNKTTEHAETDITIMQRYVDLLSKYNMWSEMFGNFTYNKKIKITSLRKSFIMLDLFSDQISKLESESIKNFTWFSHWSKLLISNAKFNTMTVNEMKFLLKLKSFTENDIFNLTILRERFFISDDLIKEAITHFNLDKKLINAFIAFSNDGLIIDGNDLIELGFKGKEIATEKTRLETERFIDKYLN